MKHTVQYCFEGFRVAKEQKKNAENQETIKTTLKVVENTTTTISSCLIEMQQTNLNTAKSLELLQKQMESTDKKVDILLERGK